MKLCTTRSPAPSVGDPGPDHSSELPLTRAARLCEARCRRRSPWGRPARSCELLPVRVQGRQWRPRVRTRVSARAPHRVPQRGVQARTLVQSRVEPQNHAGPQLCGSHGAARQPQPGDTQAGWVRAAEGRPRGRGMPAPACAPPAPALPPPGPTELAPSRGTLPSFSLRGAPPGRLRPAQGRPPTCGQRNLRVARAAHPEKRLFLLDSFRTGGPRGKGSCVKNVSGLSKPHEKPFVFWNPARSAGRAEPSSSGPQPSLPD